VASPTFVLASVSHRDWKRVLEDPELSPRADAYYLIFRTAKDVTLLVEEEDWRRLHHAVRDAKVERDFRLVTLEVELPWTVVGFFAQVSEILARAGIPLGALSSFTNDHLLIKQQDLGKALRVLGEHVGELC